MRTAVQDKYYLRDLHREIDLYDRKMVHMVKHQEFATEALRAAALRKLSTKRDLLVVNARELAQSGIEFAPHELPRSLRPEGWVDTRPAPADTEASARETAAAVSRMNSSRADGTKAETAFGAEVARLQRVAAVNLREEAPLAAALGSWQNDLMAYKKKRRKSPAVL